MSKSERHIRMMEAQQEEVRKAEEKAAQRQKGNTMSDVPVDPEPEPEPEPEEEAEEASE